MCRRGIPSRNLDSNPCPYMSLLEDHPTLLYITVCPQCKSLLGSSIHLTTTSRCSKCTLSTCNNTGSSTFHLTRLLHQTLWVCALVPELLPRLHHATLVPADRCHTSTRGCNNTAQEEMVTDIITDTPHATMVQGVAEGVVGVAVEEVAGRVKVAIRKNKIAETRKRGTTKVINTLLEVGILPRGLTVKVTSVAAKIMNTKEIIVMIATHHILTHRKETTGSKERKTGINIGGVTGDHRLLPGAKRTTTIETRRARLKERTKLTTMERKKYLVQPTFLDWEEQKNHLTTQSGNPPSQVMQMPC
mmetsp:Transcript_20834/g.43772  ORF Transcript_20834/g.43772 Transcript_20834/m.43772 type:complete len:303 (-) Transcript_20834:655-1563(-)